MLFYTTNLTLYMSKSFFRPKTKFAINLYIAFRKVFDTENRILEENQTHETAKSDDYYISLHVKYLNF